MMKNLVFIILVGAGGILSSCNYSHIKNASVEDLGDLATCGPIDFESVNKKIFSAKCVTCHRGDNAEKGVLLDSFANVKLNLDRAHEQVEQNKMPEGRPLSSDEKRYLYAWIFQGAPEITAEKAVLECKTAAVGPIVRPPIDLPVTPPTDPEPPRIIEELEANYNSINKKIFSQRCIFCHNTKAPTRKAKYDFSSFATLQTYTELFDVDDPRNSKFAQALIKGDMPQDDLPLDDAEIDVIVDWIRKGIPEAAGGPAVLKGKNPPVELPPCDDDFQDINRDIIKTSCTHCHGVRVMPALSNFADVLKNASDIAFNVELDKMPKDKALEPHLKTRLLKWIDKGSPETINKNNCDDAKEPQ